jgi:putative oxidoreductase
MNFKINMSKYSDVGLLIIRIGLGIMFITHGAPKLFGGPEMWVKVGSAAGNFGLSFMPAFWGFMAAIAEFGGGVCLISGLFFRPAMILLVINLIVASSVHFTNGQGLSGASHAIEDAIMFAGLFFMGPGPYSLDAILFNKRLVNSSIKNTEQQVGLVGLGTIAKV